MKKRILITIIVVCTVFSIIGGYVFFTSKKNTTSENKSVRLLKIKIHRKERKTKTIIKQFNTWQK